MSRRRILYFDQAPAVGGSVISLYHLVAGLDRDRYEPVVLLRASNGYADRFRELGVEVLTYGASVDGSFLREGAIQAARGGRLADLMRKSAVGLMAVHTVGFLTRALPVVRRDAVELAAKMRQVQPDLVHLNDVVCVSRAAIVAARRCGLPAICHVRAIAQRNLYDRWLSRYLRGQICISQAVRQHLASLGGRTDPNWVVYNGLNLADFEDLEAAAMGIRDELGVQDSQPLIGCVARLVPWKGAHVFVEAMAEVLAEHPDARALIVGSPEANSVAYAHGLRDRVTELGLDDRVTMWGYRADIAGLLAALDVMVHASVAPEPFGRIVIEGMAAGATVIATRAGAIPEIVDEGVTGLMVTPGDAHDMARSVIEAILSPEEGDAWRQAARRRVEESFTVERYVQGVQAVYDQVMNS